MVPLGLAERLFDSFMERRREVLAKGWPDVPEWIFSTEAGAALRPRHAERAWERVRRRAQKDGVRPLKLHCARHTLVRSALQAGKNIRWVANQLGHADPALTLRVYSHAMHEEVMHLSFAEFSVPERPSMAPLNHDETYGPRNYAEPMARRDGFAIQLRRIALRGLWPLREPPHLRFACELRSLSAAPAMLASRSLNGGRGNQSSCEMPSGNTREHGNDLVTIGGRQTRDQRLNQPKGMPRKHTPIPAELESVPELSTMLSRLAERRLRAALREQHAAALLGPRQVGKTTLVHAPGGTYVDLEVETERLRLDRAWEQLVRAKGLLVVDEAQAFAEFLPRLRAAMDAKRSRKRRFLILGSVSPELMRSVSHALTGRLALVEWGASSPPRSTPILRGRQQHGRL